MERTQENLESRCKTYEALIAANNIRMGNEPLILATYEASVQSECEIPNIDELCKSALLVKNPQAIADGEERNMQANGIELTVSVEGIEEAVKLLKVLEAQLHGVKYQAERIEAAIDNLQLKLENKIAGFSREGGRKAD